MPTMPVDLNGDYPIGTLAMRTQAGLGYLDKYTYQPKVLYFTQERLERETRPGQQITGPVGNVEFTIYDTDQRGIYDRHTGVTTMFSTGSYMLYLMIERL